VTRGGVIKGSSTETISVVGIDGIHKALAPWLEPELTANLDVANKKAAQTLATELRGEVRPVSRHMARAVRVKRARTGKPDWVVGSHRKTAFWWPFVIGGTRAHGPRKARALYFIPGWNPYLGTSPPSGASQVRTQKVRGVEANPLVERVAKRMEAMVVSEIDQDMTRMTGT